MRILKTIMGIYFLCVACTGSKPKEQEETVQQILPDSKAEVVIDTLKSKTFTSEIVSNGKLTSANVAELRFQKAEPIDVILVKNGDRVVKGQKIASLVSYSYENKLRQAKDDLEQTKLELQDILIGQGYKLQDTAKIPSEVMQLAEIKSGYAKALSQYRIASYEKRQLVLTAPINGVVANLKSAKHTVANPSEPFCNIVDMQKMNVSFSVLENELGAIRMGDKVQIYPYALTDEKMEGHISEINPWVGKDGMVEIKATVSYHPRMVEGMNVKVSIFRALEKQWVVPKTAVVLRTGKQVVFAYKNGKALWNYVRTKLENATEYTITSETLKEGDLIISSGNVNLAHESPVKVVSNK